MKNICKRFTILVCAALVTMTQAARAQTTELRVDLGQEFQIVEGFGGFLYMVPWWLGWSRYSDDEKNRLFDFLVDELGVNIVRIPLPAGIESENDNSNPNVLDMSKLDPSRIEPRPGEPGKYDGEVNIDVYALQQLWQRGVRKILMTSWSPPVWIKDSNALSGGHIRSDMRREFAESIAGTIRAYKENLGIEITHVSLFNEPEQTPTYSHTEATSDEYSALVPIVRERLNAEGLSTRIIGPEPASTSTYYLGGSWLSGNAESAVAGFAFHHYPPFMDLNLSTAELQALASTASQRGKLLWQTEISNFPETGGDISQADTYEEGLALAVHLHNALVDGSVNAWLWWILYNFHPTDEYNGRPAAQRLIYVDRETGEIKPSPKSYAMRQYSRFIVPDSRRVECTSSSSNILASAYHSSDGTVTIVAINKSSQQANLAVEIQGFGNSALHVVEYSPGKLGKSLGDLQVVGNTYNQPIPGRSIVTLYGKTSEVVVTPEPPEPDKTAPANPKNVKVTVTGSADL